MIRVFVVYEAEPNAEWYEQHAQLCQQVPGATFRHGKVFGAPMGEPMYRYYASGSFPIGTRSRPRPAPTSSWRRARTRCNRIPFHVHFADVD